MNSRSTFWVVLSFVAALGSWLLARSNKSEDSAPPAPTHAYRGYYLTDARILGTNTDGSKLYEIRAKRAEQQSDERIQFTDVEVEYSPDSDVPWSINARTATLYPDRQSVFLEGDVLATSSEGFSGDETELRTESLQFDPEAFVASTEDRIEIRIGDRTITGKGMVASLNENRMKILSNVSGRFTP